MYYSHPLNSYPMDKSVYTYISQEGGQSKPEWAAQIIITWYRKFLSGEIVREKADPYIITDPNVSEILLIEMENYVKNLGTDLDKHCKIFTTDYQPEGVLRKLYKKACLLCNIKDPYWPIMKVQFPAKFGVTYYPHDNTIIIY